MSLSKGHGVPQVSAFVSPRCRQLLIVVPGEPQRKRWEAENRGEPLPLYDSPENAVSSVPGGVHIAAGPGQAETSARGLVGRGPPGVPFNQKSKFCEIFLNWLRTNIVSVPVFDCTRFFQPRKAGQFAIMSSLADFFSQAGSDACPQIVDAELRPKSIVAIDYTVNKWGRQGASAGNYNLGFNIRAVYLLVNGPAK